MHTLKFNSRTIYRPATGLYIYFLASSFFGVDTPPKARGLAGWSLIITDAEVTDAGRILRLADEESRRDDRRRVSVLCIDASPNSHLALELAERGGGVAKFLTSDPDEEDISTALDEALLDWGEPVLTGLRLEANSPVAQAAGREVRTARE